MNKFGKTARTKLLPTALLLTAGWSLAGGGPPASGNDIVAEASYRCQGGLRVEVTQMTDSARVDYAGRSVTLKLVHDASGDHFQNAQFSWLVMSADTAALKNTRTGRLALSGCTRL